MKMLQMCFAPIVQPLVGWLLTFVALLHHQAGHGLSVLDYQLALVVIPIMTALAMVLVKHLPGRMPADEHHYESGASLLDHQPTT